MNGLKSAVSRAGNIGLPRFIAGAFIASVVAGTMAIGPGQSTAQAATDPIYWGSYVNGAPFDTSLMDHFEADAGKRESIVHWGEPWQMNGNMMGFQTKAYESVRVRGSIPMINWNSWNLNAGVDDPAYSLAAIANGTYDGYVSQWARDARAWGHPFFIRFDHEMNGSWYPWSEQRNGNRPGDYVRAWRHVHDIFTQQGATNATWVWCVNITDAQTTPLPELYPGDDYVDWTSIDGYNKATGSSSWLTFDQIYGWNPWGKRNTYQDVLAVGPSKPIMIAEIATSTTGGDAGAWIKDLLQTQLPLNYPRVKAVVWFNWNAGDSSLPYPIESTWAQQSAFQQSIGSSYYATNTFSSLPSGPVKPIGAAGPPPPTATVPPTSTATSVPATSTPTSAPTSTATSVPPTSTPTSLPTSTATSVPASTATPVVPTATSVPVNVVPFVNSTTRIRAGGPAYTASDGQVWQADSGSSSGGTYSSGAAIAKTLDPALYQTERYGNNFEYDFNLPNGQYTVGLKFAELYWTAAGKRVFNVAINNQPALSKFDILAQPNTRTNTSVDKTFTATVTNGTLKIAFTSLVDYAKVDAIEIVASPATRIHAGGAGFTGSDGRVWQADNGSTGGMTYPSNATIARTVDSGLYQTERNGDFAYNFNVPNGRYTVALKFAELFWTSAGKRVFNVAVNNQSVLANFDILAQPGSAPNTSLDKTFTTTVTNGTLTIAFNSLVDKAKVNAIEILSAP